MSWKFYDARETFGRYAKQWDAINRAQGNHILLDSLFVEPLVRYFAPPGCLLGISSDATYPGMALVTKEKAGFWQTFQPAQGPLGLIVLGSRDRADEQIVSLIHSLPGYALGFSVTQQDPDFSVFSSVRATTKMEMLEYIQTPRLRLEGTFEGYWKSRSKNLTHNLSRQRRRLSEQQSALELVTHRHPNEITTCVSEYGRLESMGWKAAEGTAIAADNQQGLFYRTMLEGFCCQGEAGVYELLLNGKVVASDFCLERDKTLVILKTTYDESISGLSLGMLMHQEIFKVLFADNKIKCVEFYGPVRDWHTKWTNDIRGMYHINFYRHDLVARMRRVIKGSFFSETDSVEKV